jgi:hypothetical protein
VPALLAVVAHGRCRPFDIAPHGLGLLVGAAALARLVARYRAG